MEPQLFIVRLYDGFDHEWMDVSDPMSYEEAKRVWDKKTDDGTHHITFDQIDYYEIFPADTIMHFSMEGEKYRKNE